MLTLYALAILDKVSPLCIVYIISPVPLVSSPSMLEFVGILSVSPGYIKLGFASYLYLTIFEIPSFERFRDL